MRGDLLVRLGFPVLAVLSMLGCSTAPKHTNTLIFGTNTKFALDVSQEPTGSLGVTLGYKRQEAVWMPLLANKNDNGNLVPADCTDDKCKAFKGTAGKAGLNGEEAVDTYSVLATFSGQATGSAGAGGNDQPGVKAGGTLAQYFATGFAARQLAMSGASIVNTAGETRTTSSVSAGVSKANAAQILVEAAKIDRIMVTITSKDGTLDKTKRDALVNKAKFQATGTKDLLLGIKSAQEVRDHLTLTYEVSGQPLFDALD
jgi:hypothetical protein